MATRILPCLFPRSASVYAYIRVFHAIRFFYAMLLAAGRDADAERKLGYLHCTVEAQKVVPTAIRPALPQAVARMLKEHGFAE